MQKHSPLELKILEQLKICMLPITFFCRCWLLIQQGVKQNDLITQDQSSRGAIFPVVLICSCLSATFWPCCAMISYWKAGAGMGACPLACTKLLSPCCADASFNGHLNAGKGSKASHFFFPHLFLVEAPLPDQVHWSSLQRTQGGSTAICQLQIKVQLQQCPLQSAAFIGFTGEI